jgi:hypothetical protein
MTGMVKLAGQRFGRLVALSYAGSSKHGQSTWLCRCDCGQEKVALGSNLRRGRTASCGCAVIDALKGRSTKHGMSRHPAYISWKAMIKRCANPRIPNWADYGGRGIKVCDRWRGSFEAFWEDNPGWQPGASLDRIDNDGNYALGNVRWASRQQQNRNQRRCRMIDTPLWGRVSLAEAAERSGIGRGTLSGRLDRNWPADRLFGSATEAAK